jgi:hypothetical protein
MQLFRTAEPRHAGAGHVRFIQTDERLPKCDVVTDYESRFMCVGSAAEVVQERCMVDVGERLAGQPNLATHSHGDQTGLQRGLRGETIGEIRRKRQRGQQLRQADLP